MQQLIKKEHKSLLYILQGQNTNYGHLYSSLERCLGEDVSFFAKYGDTGSKATWSSTQVNELKPLTDYDQDEQIIINQLVNERRSIIKGKLVAPLDKLADKLLTVPDDSAIYVASIPSGYRIVLTQWGCKTLNNPTPIVDIIEVKPPEEAKSVNVTVNCTYSDGMKYMSQSVVFMYKGIEKTMKTDENGNLRLGNMPVGESFTIQIGNEADLFSEVVRILEDIEVYNLIIPVYGGVKISVVNQLDESKENYALELSTVGTRKSVITDEEGQAFVEKIKVVEDTISISSISDPALAESHPFSRGENHIRLVITDIVQCNARILVQDKDGAEVPNYPVLVDGARHKSDTHGQISVADYNQEDVVQVVDGINTTNELSYTIVQRENEFVFTVERPPDPKVEIAIVNFWNKPRAKAEVDFTIDEVEYHYVADDKGIISIPKAIFTDQKEVKAEVKVMKKGKIYKTKKLKLSIE